MPKKSGNMSREDMNNHITKYLEHVREHDVSDISGAFMLLANEGGTDDDGNNEQHICSLMAGDPEIIAGMLCETLDRLTKASPEFSAAWHREMTKRMLLNIAETLKDSVKERENEEAAKPLAEEVIKKMMANPGSFPPSSETKH